MPTRPPINRPSYAPPRAAKHPSADAPFHRLLEWRRLSRRAAGADRRLVEDGEGEHGGAESATCFAAKRNAAPAKISRFGMASVRPY